MSRPGGVTPDCNTDGSLNLADFWCLQTKLAQLESCANCNNDAVLNLAGFGCFMTGFAVGCP